VHKAKGWIEQINAIIIVKFDSGSPVTRLEKESKKPKISGKGTCRNSELIGPTYEKLNGSKEVNINATQWI